MNRRQAPRPIPFKLRQSLVVRGGLRCALTATLFCGFGLAGWAQEPPAETESANEAANPAPSQAANQPIDYRQGGALQLQQPVERELAGGQADVFTVELTQGQFLHVVAQQNGVHISLGLIGPDGKRLMTANRPNGNYGIEQASVIASSSGTYKVQALANNPQAPAGKYRIQVTDLRAPTPDDLTRLKAERITLVVASLRRQADAESRGKAVAFLKDSVALWHALRDDYEEALALQSLATSLSTTGSPRAALDYYNQALPLERAAGDRTGEAATLNGLGMACRRLGEMPKALDYYNQALAIRRAVGDRAGEASELNNLGLIQKRLGEIKKAVDLYSQAVTIHREMGNRTGEATTLTNLGAAYQALGDMQKALEYYSQALPIRRSVHDRAGEATTLASLGAMYKAEGDIPKALDYYNQALPLQRSAGDRSGEASTLGSLGSAYEALGEMPKALDYFSQALSIQEAVGDRSAEATTLNNLGLANRKLGEVQKALDYYNRALPLLHGVGDRLGEATTLNNLGALSAGMGDMAKAQDYYTQALAIHRAVGDRAGEAVTLNNLGGLSRSLGDIPKALDYFNQSLAIRRAVGDRNGEAVTLDNIGGLHRRMGELPQALDYYNQSLAIHRAGGDRDGEAATLNGLGSLHTSMGEMQKGLECYNQALALYRAVGDRNGEASTLDSLGGVYFDLGETAKALEFLNQALPIERAVGSRAGEATTLNNLALMYRSMGETDKALDYYNQALTLEHAVQDRAGEATTLNNLGTLYRATGDKQKALEYFDQALPLHRAVEDRAAEATTLNNLASLNEALGNNEQAVLYFLQSLALAHSIGLPQAEGITLCNLMHYWRAQKNYPLAIFFGKQAINKFQQIRENIAGLDRDLQESYVGTVTASYRRLADLLVEEGRLPEAEQVLGLLKEQEYTEFTRGGNSAGSTAPLAFTSRENQAGALTAEAMEWLTLRSKDSRTPEEDARMNSLGGTVRLASSTTETFFQQLQSALAANAGPAHARDVSSETSDSQSLLRDLGSGTVAVYTLVLENELDTIVVTPAVTVPHKIPIARAELSRKVLALLEALKNPASDPRPASAALYAILVAPIAADLAGAQAHTVLWSLDDVLRYVPVNALYDGKTYLVEHYGNVVFTAANTSRLKEQPEVTNWRALGMGISKQYEPDLNPLAAVPAELDGVVRDAAVAGSHGPVPGRIMLNDAFTEKDMADQLWKKYPLVHIASHFVLEPGSEENSYLLLGGKDTGGKGYHLSLAELQHDPDLDFHSAELLTLSACDTGTGGAGDGREVDGLGMLAQKKGAKAVLATLWSVNDASTSELMTDFYARWTSSKGDSKIEALRQAQLDLLDGRDPSAKAAGGAGASGQDAAGAGAPSRGFAVHTPAAASAGAKFSHPYYWAPFILMGNWQ
ncbi:MAG TPA: tetratricopeptide repeat protein [Terriglobia bacterium]|nr:tetratricopeptide repeat protein [Terriglobia bacterium]